ncbi:carbohydrate sulfotransferase 11-like [Acanthaster planci]|uniref:Carbohydrate sulfotransferase n=1 Tax=Acanthaster planci TaxID=133434 RepID=A0A8B7XG01_ACAPL|nr:carbohydrate sulfotransferase 11-like [Acanthaster planci]
MAVRGNSKRHRSKLVLGLLFLVVSVMAVVGTLSMQHTMTTWTQNDMSKVEIDRVPVPAPGPRLLRLEDDWWDKMDEEALFKKALRHSVNRSQSESSQAQEESGEDMSSSVSKPWERTIGIPKPAPNRQMTSTSQNQVRVLHKSNTLAHEACDRACRWWREQDRRHRRVQETCANAVHKHISPALHYQLTPETLRTMSHLLVLDSHKIIYCYVPKVSCTNWKRILLVAKGIFPSVKKIEQRQTHLATDSHMRTLSSYPLATATRLLKEYKKFLFVRHPFERILSAYIDKFQMDYPASKHFRETSAVEMVRYGDVSNTQRLKDGTLNISFQQFSRYISDPKNQNLEPHWQEMYRQCQPCMIKYDYIGNYSTLKEDADFIIKATNLNQPFPDSTNPTGSSKQSKIRRFFSQLTAADIGDLYRRYSTDFQLFGYSVPPYISNRTFT